MEDGLTPEHSFYSSVSGLLKKIDMKMPFEVNFF